MGRKEGGRAELGGWARAAVTAGLWASGQAAVIAGLGAVAWSSPGTAAAPSSGVSVYAT